MGGAVTPEPMDEQAVREFSTLILYEAAPGRMMPPLAMFKAYAAGVLAMYADLEKVRAQPPAPG